MKIRYRLFSPEVANLWIAPPDGHPELLSAQSVSLAQQPSVQLCNSALTSSIVAATRSSSS